MTVFEAVEHRQTTMDVIPSTVVLEVLNKYNYEDWSEVVKSYLVARNLWDVVKPDVNDDQNSLPGESDGHDVECYKLFFNAIELALHYAVSSKDNEEFVKDMLTHMSKEDLERKESSCGWTALAQAIASGTPKMVQWMIDENDSLPHIEDNVHTIPIVMVLNFQRMDLVYILYHATELEVLSDLKGGKHGAALISRCIKMKKAGKTFVY
ncbi:hypothetical protein TIFTF001_043559 [Ficus carica]|uniref:DUF4219 domain-containing protein n=1 Tax=Ficus carica TaxID=3494 RepID=A0AA88CLU1_FICCA|nr:hypothetical protein TIFTF001_043559 [Ficus carica]